MIDPDADARVRAAKALAGGDATAWFEPLYAAAAAGDAVLPWHRGEPNPEIADWAAGARGDGKRAIVIGCALGDDAEYVASLGYETTAFDVSPSAITTVRQRFPESCGLRGCRPVRPAAAVAPRFRSRRGDRDRAGTAP